MAEEKLYSAGEIAKIAGVSLRTIRFYDEKGLLKPVLYSEAGYRYYDKESMAILQRILMLKYLGFSLQQIEKMIQNDVSAPQNTNKRLAEQKQILLEKKEQLEQMISTIEIMEKSNEEERWRYLVRLLNLLTEEEKIQEQYKDSSNLEKRIRIHDYSTSSEEWMKWVYGKMQIDSGNTVLEIGCGTGLLWVKNIHRLPQGIHLILTDQSEGILEEAKRNLAGYGELLKNRSITIDFRIMDANELSLEKESCDIIIANHMLYHVKKREECLRAIGQALKPTGAFFCSTVGKAHMRELDEMILSFDCRMERPIFSNEFQLENAVPQLNPFFSKIERFDHENDLIVDNAEVIYNYADSYPGNVHFVLAQRGEEFMAMIRDKIEKEGAIFIHKSTGMFVCRK